mmetsp:Transcript_7489/g.15588  ORF Transcript_7489/g.15588 Transcript_7489/m.15588 type:complete len:242 (+) Transcript_7489:1661-2386(+)
MVVVDEVEAEALHVEKELCCLHDVCDELVGGTSLGEHLDEDLVDLGLATVADDLVEQCSLRQGDARGVGQVLEKVDVVIVEELCIPLVDGLDDCHDRPLLEDWHAKNRPGLEALRFVGLRAESRVAVRVFNIKVLAGPGDVPRDSLRDRERHTYRITDRGLANPQLALPYLAIRAADELEERDSFRVEYAPAHLEHLVDDHIGVSLVGDVLDHPNEGLHALLGMLRGVDGLPSLKSVRGEP